MCRTPNTTPQKGGDHPPTEGFGCLACISRIDCRQHGQAAGQQNEPHDRDVGDAVKGPRPFRSATADKSEPPRVHRGGSLFHNPAIKTLTPRLFEAEIDRCGLSCRNCDLWGFRLVRLMPRLQRVGARRDVVDGVVAAAIGYRIRPFDNYQIPMHPGMNVALHRNDFGVFPALLDPQARTPAATGSIPD